MKLTSTIILLLVLVVLTSGCVGIPDVFGRDVISVQQNTVQNGIRDTVVIKDTLTIPKSPLLPDQQVVFSFIAENRDNLKKARVVVDLFNAPTMRDITGARPCNLYTGSTDPSTRYCLPNQCAVPNGCDILPGEEKQINFLLRTPGEAEIANIKTDTKLDFKLVYDFSGTLTYLIPAIGTEEIVKRQRSGDKTILFTSKSYSSGPVQVDVEMQGAPYMLSDTGGRQTETVLQFKVRNIGNGEIANSKIDGDKMTIVFPPEMEVVQGKHSNKFVCTETNEGTVCVNSATGDSGEELGAIELYRDESRSSMFFTVRLKNPLIEPFRTFQITSMINYQYELRNSVSLTINPFQNA